jgi:hypothetical protein
MKFPYAACISWLRKRAAELTARGFTVEAKENAVPVQSFLLKIARSNVEAE